MIAKLLGALLAISPVILKLVEWFMNADKRAQEKFMAELPGYLKGISDAEKKATADRDPSGSNRNLNSNK